MLGANVNCQAKDKATPLLIAAQEGHTECLELLLASGADANLYCNKDNWQLPIHAAAEMGHKKWVIKKAFRQKVPVIKTGSRERK